MRSHDFGDIKKADEMGKVLFSVTVHENTWRISGKRRMEICDEAVQTRGKKSRRGAKQRVEQDYLTV